MKEKESGGFNGCQCGHFGIFSKILNFGGRGDKCETVTSCITPVVS